MKKFESNKFQHNLNSEFRKNDKFLYQFQIEFFDALVKVIEDNDSFVISHELLYENLILYANQIFGTAESVYDKDLNYPEDRLKDELDTMFGMIKSYSFSKQNQELAAQTHRKAKEIMVKFFPDLINLSANGFRLLEKYCQMYNLEFIVNFDEQITFVH